MGSKSVNRSPTVGRAPRIPLNSIHNNRISQQIIHCILLCIYLLLAWHGMTMQHLVVASSCAKVMLCHMDVCIKVWYFLFDFMFLFLSACFGWLFSNSLLNSPIRISDLPCSSLADSGFRSGS
ncbi:hypothetical protein O6H91_18G041300 [Diphasiastrum complanatum]|uniref:Uncharacterized protein n=1 Tax=Diphasiastrum complanatum TaxID=34168 RepID=A0ACC2B0C8_DIPCM|nr:hypothetical protein O6H91_18G041300 [Diphasiastrum complanatum]